jgi:hypothetical protein
VDRRGGRWSVRLHGVAADDAHAEFDLTAEQFAEVGAEIVRALEYFGVPEQEQQELMEAYRGSMSEVVTATARDTTS